MNKLEEALREVYTPQQLVELEKVRAALLANPKALEPQKEEKGTDG